MSQDRGILWDSGDAYEQWVGRWSRRVAPLFLDWLAVPPQAEWIDIGCGTGALSSAILARATPNRVAGIDPSEAFDDGIQASICRPGPLAALFRAAGLSNIEVEALDITTAFDSFGDYWSPFLAGTGSAPKYCASLPPDAQGRLRERIRDRLPTGLDGEILLAARAWAVRGTVADG